MNTLAVIALVSAALPAGLFLLNLFAYRAPRERQSGAGSRGAGTLARSHSVESQEKAAADAAVRGPQRTETAPGGSWQKTSGDTETCDDVAGDGSVSISVLIPARNEELNIRATLDSILLDRESAFEIVVLDDQSTDRTSGIVAGIAERDPRVRLETAPALPSGWCGKQHACHVLSRVARGRWLVFLDADVRLTAGALPRMVTFMQRSGAALASGVPRQELGTFSERLLLPLIHFILLGFLSMHIMRRTRWPAMSAGCGQLFIASRDAYQHCGGHAQLRGSLHDGIKLPRVFRRSGMSTDLFDATDLAICRMYHTNAETWRGLSKNATEGLAAPGTIVPMTVLLLCGQVMPLLLLGWAPHLSPVAFLCCLAGTGLAFLPRLIGVFRFRQPFGSALLHPIGVLALLAIQWMALIRHLLGRPSEWKGRSYGASTHMQAIRNA